MHSLYLISFYGKWHYTQGFRDLYRNWRSFVLFVLHFFSLRLLFRTWLSPFGRLDEEYKKGFDLEGFLETLIVNTMMRLVGFVLRTFVIVSGLVSLVAVLLLGPVLFVLWIFTPFLVLILLLESLVNLLS